MDGAPRTPRRVAFLDHFDAAQIERVLWYLERVRCEPGDILITEGGVDRTLFIAIRGRFQVSSNAQVLGVLEAGHVFGELAFFDAAPRSAAITAQDDGEVLRLTRAGFEDMSRRDPALACSVAMEIGRALSQRFREEQEKRQSG